MMNLPADLQEIVTHEPRFVDVDQADRSSSGGDSRWWRGLTDTTQCYDPSEIAHALREKGLSQAEAEEGAVWLRPAGAGEFDTQ